jgi:hypothetical protein
MQTSLNMINQSSPERAQFKMITSDLISVKPFKMYKTWNLVSTTSSFTTSASYNVVQSTIDYVTVYNGIANFNLDMYNDTNIENNSLVSGSAWYSIRNLFYGKVFSSGSGSLSEPSGATILPPYYDEFEQKSLSGNALILSIPQIKFGDGVVPSTVKLTNTNNIVKPYTSPTSINIIDNGYGNLYDTNNSNFTASVGNISYDFGLLIITEPSYSAYFSNSLFVSNSLTNSQLNYTSYYTAYSNEIICPVKSYEFNNTLNPTAYVTDASGNKVFRFEDIYDASGSIVNFRPLATGIALYDGTNRPVVFAKFAKPIRIENDMDSIFIIRFDM